MAVSTPTDVGKNTPSEVFSGLGLYLWMWGIFTAYMFIASLRTTGAVALVFLLLAITYIVLGIGNSALAGSGHAINGTIKLGGYIGILTAIAASGADTAARQKRARLNDLSGVQLEIRQPRIRGQHGRRQPCRRSQLTPGAKARV